MKKALKVVGVSILTLVVLLLAIFTVRLYQEQVRSWRDFVDLWNRKISSVRQKMNKIAFIRNGNVWIVNPDGTNEEQLTHREWENLQVKPKEVGFEHGEAIMDSEKLYNDDFFELPTISPDGANLAVMAYSKRLAEVIDSGDEELRRSYLAGDYWIPAHHDLYIFNLLTGNQKVIRLEENPLMKDERIEKLYWSKDNSKIYFITINHRLFLLDAKTGKFKEASVKPWSPNSNYLAYVPESEALIYWNLFGSAVKPGKLMGIRLWDLNAKEQELLSFSREHSDGEVITGTESKVYFWTVLEDKRKLYSFDSKRNTYEQLLEVMMCTDNIEARPCVALPASTGSGVSPQGKYFYGSVNVTFNPEFRFESVENDIYRLSDLQKVFDFSDEYSSGEFVWGVDGETILALRQDGDLDVIFLKEGNVKRVTKGANFGRFDTQVDWNYLN